jgi:V8-like Glu-specific endopeptidase
MTRERPKTNSIVFMFFISFLFISPVFDVTSSEAAVLGKDDRKSLPEQYQAIAAGIGVIGQPGAKGWRCTAFCVAPNIVATNAHCIVRNPTVGKRLNLAKTIFILPALTKSPLNHKYKPRISYPEYVHKKMPGLSIYSGNYAEAKYLNSQKQDWAFTKLIHSVCRGRTLSFTNKTIKEVQKAAKKNNLFMIGYHGDKDMSERLYSDKCRIRSRNNRTFFLKKQRRQMTRDAVLLPHTCDAFKGSSGSPIILKNKDSYKVVGINLGSLKYEHFRIKRNRYTGKIISRKKLKTGRETNIAIQPKIFTDGLKRFEKETLLTNLIQFKKVQTGLKALGLYKGKIDGRFGRRTKKAIFAFETKMGLAPMGLPTQELYRKIHREVLKEKSSKL